MKRTMAGAFVGAAVVGLIVWVPAACSPFSSDDTAAPGANDAAVVDAAAPPSSTTDAATTGTDGSSRRLQCPTGMTLFEDTFNEGTVDKWLVQYGEPCAKPNDLTFGTRADGDLHVVMVCEGKEAEAFQVLRADRAIAPDKPVHVRFEVKLDMEATEREYAFGQIVGFFPEENLTFTNKMNGPTAVIAAIRASRNEVLAQWPMKVGEWSTISIDVLAGGNTPSMTLTREGDEPVTKTFEAPTNARYVQLGPYLRFGPGVASASFDNVMFCH